MHAVDRFKKARLGMFIHYGLYSLLNRREWVLFDERIPVDEYRRLAGEFRPGKDVVRDWVILARESGMRYACLTTRHHDGFSLFETRASEFHSANSAAKRDLVREFVEACREEGVRPTLYYSVGDWSDPGYQQGPEKDPAAWERYVETVHIQLKELMSGYGPIDYLFYDGCPAPETWKAAELNAELRKLQPDLLISDRCGLDEDVASSENKLSTHDKPWECCMTTNGSWGCNAGDLEYKSLYMICRSLAFCVHNGGNFLLNTGPLPDGTISLKDRELFGGLGRWARTNAEAVFETKPNPFAYHDRLLSSYRNQTTYSPLHWYHGPRTVITGVGNRVLKARLLAFDKEISFEQRQDRVLLTGLPSAPPDVLPVVALELDGPPQGVPNAYQGGAAKPQAKK